VCHCDFDSLLGGMHVYAHAAIYLELELFNSCKKLKSLVEMELK
jgi:hypothetical protein